MAKDKKVTDVNSSYGHPMTLDSIHQRIIEQGLDPIKHAAEIMLEVRVHSTQHLLSRKSGKNVKLDTSKVESYIRVSGTKK